MHLHQKICSAASMLSFVLQFFFFPLSLLSNREWRWVLWRKRNFVLKIRSTYLHGSALLARPAQEAEHQKRNADETGRESLMDLVSDAARLSFPPWENFATADVEREMTHVSGSRAQWQSTDLFLTLTSPVFVGIAFVCVLGRHYKWQIFPLPLPLCTCILHRIPVTMAVPNFLVCSGTGWRLQSQKRSKSLLNVFSPKGPVLVASRFRPLALFVTSRHRAQRRMKLSQSHSLNLQSFCMSWSKIVPRCVKTGRRTFRPAVVTCLQRRQVCLVRSDNMISCFWGFFSHDFSWPTNFQHLVPL